MNDKIIKTLTESAAEIRKRKAADAGDRVAATAIEDAIRHLAGADAKRAAGAKDSAPAAAAAALN